MQPDPEAIAQARADLQASESEILGWIQRSHPEWMELAVYGAVAEKAAAVLAAERASVQSSVAMDEDATP